MALFLRQFVVVPIILLVLCLIGLLSASPVPPYHLHNAVRQIRQRRILPANAVVIGSVPSIQVSSFKVDDYSGRSLNLQNLLGYDIPSDIIQKLETRVQTIRF